MKAVVLKKPKTLELMEVPDFKLTAENHVMIQVQACGICGSDLRYWAGENPWALHTLGKDIENPPNMILGHEFAGVVIKVNSPRYQHLIGERVGVQSFRVCKKCRFCKTGRSNLCQDMIHIGHAQGWGKMDFYPGAYAEYCLGWADMLHLIPENLTYAEAAMADILCVAIHVVGRTRLYHGANVLCIGGGPAGLSIAQVAKIQGAGTIFISDPSPLVRQVLSQYPDFIIIDPGMEKVENVIQETIAAEKCAAIFDSVGSAATMAMALSLLEESGTYVNLAVHNTAVQLNTLALGSERTITTSSNAFYRDLSKAFELLIFGQVNVKPWITHRFPLKDYQEAFALLAKTPKQAFKVIFEPWR